MTDLQHRVVLVTGGSAGIGRATVRRLAAGGARVVTCARDGDRLREAVGALPGVTTTRADLADAADRAALVERVLTEHGRIDAVVHNAGLGWAGLVEDMPGEAVEGVVATNLTAVVELTRLCLPHLLATAGERGRADVLAVSSVAAWSQVPPLTVYSATKAGLQGFVTGLRREVTARGVRVHSVNPFFVRTEWLARGHGHAPVSDADAEGRLSRGIDPDRVADRIADCLAAPRSRTVAVPRWSGIARLGELPPVDRVLDAVLSRRAATVRRAAGRVVSRRTG
ncbi:SDR family NAD(P)-dependent oxidoreductase [Blastococcus sp. TBT05-19]|uniref:SDR family NAD(P)-dependent oxidoreductase n=1 Tax=Blastococcus sp. TBT05-19 TaxID=2250581 RepID=UPI000DE8C240|nr:SDR family oxidoreductase [Blastococcus sp. TBT05-19]RBY94893.1 SDR family NAD(P)-dependent oxidoreductase [Blastococcus sp. TBT05-19]